MTDDVAYEAGYTDEFGTWYESLGDEDAAAVYKKVGLLESLGPGLLRPHADKIRGAPFDLRELVIQSKGRPLRAFYSFHNGKPVLITGGDKKGVADRAFYKRFIALADKIWKQFLMERVVQEKGSVKRR
jgi:hypothetical protein